MADEQATRKEEEPQTVRIARAAYVALDSGDRAGLLAFCVTDANVFIPCSRTIMVDHERYAVPAVLEQLLAPDRKMPRKLFGITDIGHAAIAVMHDHVQYGGGEAGYHAIHEWDIAGGAI